VSWTRARVTAWAIQNLPLRFRSCHVGAAAERTLDHWSYGQAILAALKKYGLICIVDGRDVPHAEWSRGFRGGCQAKKRGPAWKLILDREPDEVLAKRLREMCDL
jgi:hypothetical protein